MSKLINFQVKKLPASRIIGKQVTMSINPGVKNPATELWQTMWKDGTMELLKNIPGRSTEDPDTLGWRGDYDLEANTFAYIVGVLTKEGTDVPKGFIYRDIPECSVAVGGIQGRDEGGDIHRWAHKYVAEAMKENGYEYDRSAGGFELEYYSYNRFAVPHYLGEKILIMDFYCPCKKIKAHNIDTEKNIEMVVESGLGKSFHSLGERIIYSYRCTYPDCITMEEEVASDTSQRHMHSFLKDVISSIYKDPSLINIKAEKDDFFENWMLLNSRQELVDSMRKIEKSLLDFYSYLYKLGEAGEVKDNKLYVSKDKMRFVKKRLTQLEQFGLLSENNNTATVFHCEKYPELFPAWKLLYKYKLAASKCELLRFLYCMYNVSNYRAEHLFGNVSGNGDLIRELEEYFQDNGYDTYFDERGIRWEKEYPNKQKAYGGFFFDGKRRDQMTYSFHLPSFRLVVNNFDQLDEELKSLVFSRAMKCSGCGYCTQTDKMGKRKPLTLVLEHNGQRIGKCPLFPNLTWRYIDEREVKGIIKLFDFAVKLV